MRIKYFISSSVSLVAKWAYFEPKIIGSIPRLYTNTQLFFIASWDVVPHQSGTKSKTGI